PAGDADPGFGVVAAELADCLPRLPDCFAGDRAGIHDDSIGKAGFGGARANDFRFICVQPTAESHDFEGHDARTNAARSASPAKLNRAGPVISTWSSLSRHSMSRSPPSSLTLVLPPVSPT